MTVEFFLKVWWHPATLLFSLFSFSYITWLLMDYMMKLVGDDLLVMATCVEPVGLRTS
jgi:hypothetical protein